MARIMAEILAGMYPNCITLAEKLECSTRTIKRDVDFLRDRLNVPMEYDRRRWGYFYNNDAWPGATRLCVDAYGNGVIVAPGKKGKPLGVRAAFYFHWIRSRAFFSISARISARLFLSSAT